MPSVSPERPERSPREAPPLPATDRPLTVTMYDPKSPDTQVREATTYDGKQIKTRKRKTMSNEERAKVALVRKLGACDVCKARRVRCSPDHHRDPSRFNQNKGSLSSGLSSEASAHRPLQILPAFAQASPMPGYINEQRKVTNLGAVVNSGSNIGGVSQSIEYAEPAVFNQDPALHESSQPPAKKPASNGALSIQAMAGVEPSDSAPFSAVDRWAQSPLRHETLSLGLAPPMDLEHFGKSLEDAVKGLLPDQSSRYKSVHVLVLQWELNLLDTAHSEVLRLVEVFRNLYGFDVELGFIPQEQPSRWISRKMIDFVDKADDSRDSLKILYYGGHSFISESRENIWSSHPKDHPRSCVLNMKSVQDMLVEANSDALLILDACATGSSMSSSTGRGVTELIAAWAWNQESLYIPYTFTRALVIELSQFAHKPPFSIGYLFSNLFVRMQNRIEVDGQKSPRISVPIHLVLSSPDVPRSIRLGPLKCKEAVESVSAPGSGSVQKNSGGEGPRLLFSIRLSEKGENPSVDLFKEWLRTIPATVTDIKVEAEFNSF